MVRRISILFLLLFVAAGYAMDDIAGDPNYSGCLEFVYPNAKSVVHVDGIIVEATDGMKSVMELTHGEHLFQVFAIKGTLSKELISEEHINIPGGYTVRATLKDGKVSVIDTVPLPEYVPLASVKTPQEQAEAALHSSQTSTATTTIVTTIDGTTMSMGMSSGMTVTKPTMITSSETASMAESIQTAQTMAIRLSRIIVMSEEGNCEIYLDGQKKLELGFGDIDELAMGKIPDVKPGMYQLKIVGFDVWYEGKIDVGSDEVIKIRTEPGKMDIVSRVSQP